MDSNCQLELEERMHPAIDFGANQLKPNDQFQIPPTVLQYLKRKLIRFLLIYDPISSIHSMEQWQWLILQRLFLVHLQIKTVPSSFHWLGVKLIVLCKCSSLSHFQESKITYNITYILHSPSAYRSKITLPKIIPNRLATSLASFLFEFPPKTTVEALRYEWLIILKLIFLFFFVNFWERIKIFTSQEHWFV